MLNLRLNDAELEELWARAKPGLDMSPGDELCKKALTEILYLREQNEILSTALDSLEKSPLT